MGNLDKHGENLDIDFIITENVENLFGENEISDGAIIHECSDGKNNLYIGDCRVTDNFNVGNMDDNIQTMKVGGLEPTTIAELKKKSMSQIIIDMICPLTYPVKKTNPSIGLSYSKGKLIEVGDMLPLKEDINVTVNSGKWSDNTDYAGPCGEVSLVMNPDKWGEESIEGSYTITGEGTFESGPMSKDSHGNDYQSYSGGNVLSPEFVINAVYPIYINTEDIDVMTKQPLVDYNSLRTIYVDIPSEVLGTMDKFQIWLPYEFSIFVVRQWDDFN